jgi:hypothetical protein
VAETVDEAVERTLGGGVPFADTVLSAEIELDNVWNSDGERESVDDSDDDASGDDVTLPCSEMVVATVKVLSAVVLVVNVDKTVGDSAALCVSENAAEAESVVDGDGVAKELSVGRADEDSVGVWDKEAVKLASGVAVNRALGETIALIEGAAENVSEEVPLGDNDVDGHADTLSVTDTEADEDDDEVTVVT